MTVMANTKVVTSNFSARSTNSGLSSHHFYLRIEFLYLRHYQWGQGKVSQNLLETFNNRPWFSALHNNDFDIKDKSKSRIDLFSVVLYFIKIKYIFTQVVIGSQTFASCLQMSEKYADSLRPVSGLEALRRLSQVWK